MPVDFSLLMGSTPPMSFAPIHNYHSEYHSFDPDIGNGRAWKRNSTYPMSHNGELCSTKPTCFKLANNCRSLSEMALPEAAITMAAPTTEPVLSSSAPSAPTHTFGLEQLKEELAKLRAEEREEMVAECKLEKKRVVFADEEGLELCEVRVMTEPSDVPPKLNNSVLRALLGEAACEEARPSATWYLNFTQPASEYLKFRQTLERQNVALENVILRNEECTLSGTIKVRNLCFRKEVLVRLTEDSWSSYKDYPATYAPPAKTKNGSSGGETWETFSFHIQIPCDDEKRRRLDFCICFRALEEGKEFWDSNGSANFSVLSGKSIKAPSPIAALPHRPITNDAYSLPSQYNYAHFSVWSDLADTHPYY